MFSAPEKRLDALILCTAEIFVYLEENLRLTPESMSDKGTALDELQEMHQQVWIYDMSLHQHHHSKPQIVIY